MNYTFTLSEAGLMAIGLALLVLLIYCIILIRNLIPAVKRLNHILEDVEEITDTTSSGIIEASKLVGEIGSSISAVSGTLKGENGTLQNLTTLVKSVSSAIGLFKNKNS